MNFKIKEQNSPSFSEFKKMYMDPNITREEICEKFGMGHIRFHNWGRDVSRETGFRRKACGGGFVFVPVDDSVGGGVRVPRFYCWNGELGKWTVQKSVGGVQVYFGAFESEEVAQKVVEWLKEHEWSKESLKEMVL